MKAYVDSSIWISLIEDNGNYRDEIVMQLSSLEKNWTFCISHAVIMETMYKPYRDSSTQLISIYDNLYSSLVILPNYLALFDESVQLMKDENLKAMDAIHLAHANHYGCDAFVLTDSHFKNLTSGS